ncbi:MAG: hypothetical protein V7711_13425 [Pseudomonadales bacterium]
MKKHFAIAVLLFIAAANAVALPSLVEKEVAQVKRAIVQNSGCTTNLHGNNYQGQDLLILISLHENAIDTSSYTLESHLYKVLKAVSGSSDDGQVICRSSGQASVTMPLSDWLLSLREPSAPYRAINYAKQHS